MDSSDSLRICLVGLPKTGKTTFIAALWAYLTSGPPEDAYRIAEYPADPKYLNEISDAWAKGQAMPRNSLGAEDRIEFTIAGPGKQPVTLVLPDLPGEAFLNAVVRPAIDEQTAVAVIGSDLLLVFVNGEKAKTYSALGDQQTTWNEAQVQEPREFAIEELDTDTLTTELLQRLDYLLQDHGRPAIAVVVSAWDAVCDSASTPGEWLGREQPMLAQLLAEFALSSEVGVMAISAQGANYKREPAVIEQLADTRPWGADETGKRTDICGPLAWFRLPPGRYR